MSPQVPHAICAQHLVQTVSWLQLFLMYTLKAAEAAVHRHWAELAPLPANSCQRHIASLSWPKEHTFHTLCAATVPAQGCICSISVITFAATVSTLCNVFRRYQPARSWNPLYFSKPPEPVRGRVVRPAQEPRGRGVQDGVAAFVDAAGLEFHCAYGNHQVPQPPGP